MKAELITGAPPGGKRQKLAECLPLDTPYLVQFFPIYACNFTCKYCHNAIPINERQFVTDEPVMRWELFEKCISDMTRFPNKIRTIRFVGMGEPLLHKDIVRMIRLTKESGCANKVELLTNGSLLTPDVSDGLIDAGLDRLVISLQGITAEQYEEISKIKLDFDRFVEQIRYFYEHKQDTVMYLKIVDIALPSEEDRQKYFDIFGDICDTIGIETTVPIFEDVPFNEELYKRAEYKTQFGLPMKRIRVCPQAFYSMQINPDGKVVGCHAIYYPRILDDCNDKSLVDVWNGEGFSNFRKEMLKGRENVCQTCIDCGINDFRMFPEDDISDYAEELTEKYGF